MNVMYIVCWERERGGGREGGGQGEGEIDK